MKNTYYSIRLFVFSIFIYSMLIACNNGSQTISKQPNLSDSTIQSNPVVYFEIPVTNIDRAIKFYKKVFNFSFEKEVIDNNEMAIFPFSEEKRGISGALAKGEIYQPTKKGVLIYFATENIDKLLQSATLNGGKILYPKTDNGIGLVAELEDTEGNRIALFQSK